MGVSSSYVVCQGLGTYVTLDCGVSLRFFFFFFLVAIRFPCRWTKEGVKQKITCYLIRKWRLQSIRPYIIGIWASYPSPNRFSHRYPSLVKQTVKWHCGWSRPILICYRLHQSKKKPDKYVNILHCDCSPFSFRTAAEPLLSKTGLAKPLSAHARIVYKIRRNSFACPREYWRTK
jgi:hypothetical protein